MTREVDVLIVTALKLEFEQVLKVDTGAYEDGWTEERGPLGLDVAFRSFRCKGGVLRVAVTWATDMGMVATSTAAIPLVEKYKPKCIAMCGVCAGRPGKVELGDVIVAERLWTYDGGKEVHEKNDEGQEVKRLQGDVLTYNITPDWKQRAERFIVDPSWPWLSERPVPYVEQERWALGLALGNRLAADHPERKTRCPDWREVLLRLWQKKMLTSGNLTLTPKGKAHVERERLLYPDGFGEAKPLGVHVGPIGTGNKVVEDPTIWGRLSESIRKVLGLEMEACAIGAIAHAQVGRDMRAIVMKGVMDVANPDRDDRYKPFAARASAEILLWFLREHLEPTKRELEPGPPPKTGGVAPTVVKGPIRMPARRSEEELVGRSELLAEVRRALEDQTHRGVALHGITGVGKTSIAETIGATDHERGVYPGGVFEASGLSEDLFLSGLASIAEALGTSPSASEEQKVGVARQRLAQATQRTLLIVDDIDPTAPWLERELRSLPACVRVLVTLTLWPSGFLSGPGRARWMEVPALAPDSAYALVKSLAPFLGDAEIAKLDGFLNGYTLGLEVAARTLASEPMLGVDGYLASLAAVRKSMGQGATEREKSALSALRVQWDHLPEAARRAWAICGAFGNAPVPDGWLKLALASAGLNEADARSGIGELVKRHLATRVVDGEEVSLRFHPIVHAFSRFMAADDDRRAMAAGITRWFDGTWDSEPNLYIKARMTLPHVVPALQGGAGDPQVARRLAVALRLNGRQESLDRAVTMLRSLLSQSRDEPAHGVDAIEWVRHELARLFIERGIRDQLLEAEKLLRAALERRDDGTNKPTVAVVVTLNDLGIALRNLDGPNRLQEAEQVLRRALQMEETLSGGDLAGEATAMTNLANVLTALGGRDRLDEAEQLNRRALQIEETSFGREAPTLGLTLFNLANVLTAQGGRDRRDEVENLQRRALQITETALGGDAPSIARRLTELARVLLDRGGNKRLVEAEQLLRRAHMIDSHAFPDGSDFTAKIATNLAIVLRKRGGEVRIREAQRLEGRGPQKNRSNVPTKKRRS